jgi:RND family efflux transporter MFP subunit
MAMAIPAAAIGLAAALALAGPAGAQGQPSAPPVDVAKPLAREIVDFDIYTGRFEAVDRVEIRSRVSGYLDKVGFQDGDIVPQGALLFVIDQRTFRAEVARAEANVAAGESQRALAKVELDRATTLAARQFGTAQDVDKATAALAGAEAQVAVAEAELRSARLNLEFTEMRAPFAGQMSNRKVDPGNLVVGGTNNATLLSTIVSIDPIHFVFTASEADFLRYSRLAGTGDRLAGLSSPYSVEVRLMDEEDFTHQGTLDFVDNQIDPNSGTITARAVLPNPDHFLVPGTFGRIRLAGSGKFTGMLIPDEAVIADQARKIVYVIDAEGTVGVRPVKLGSLYKGLRVVKEGLGPDDTVIVNGILRARPGAKVTPQEITLKVEGE